MSSEGPGSGGEEHPAVDPEVAALRERLARVNEPKGFFFNFDDARVHELLAGLLANRSRYGYMVCPCRLASGDREADRDIICPCEYRPADVAEFGSCYCNLYVTADYNAERRPPESIPERRPPERSPF
jgi:ferredoxin-thioredoxin reductase catalytic chain